MASCASARSLSCHGHKESSHEPYSPTERSLDLINRILLSRDAQLVEARFVSQTPSAKRVRAFIGQPIQAGDCRAVAPFVDGETWIRQGLLAVERHSNRECAQRATERSAHASSRAPQAGAATVVNAVSAADSFMVLSPM
jgi:hypothetical protein